MSELRFTVIPLGAGDDITSVTCLLEFGGMLITVGLKATVAWTRTVVLTVPYPLAVAVMVAEPKSTPYTLVK